MADGAMNSQTLPSPNQQTLMTARNPIDTIAQSRVVRHLAKLAGLAAAVAIGMVVIMWSAEPNYAPLYSNMSGQDSAQISDVLIANQIDFKLDVNTGSVLVDQSRLAEARLKLASQGLPEGTSQGLEMLQQDQGLGTSQFIEKARYNHALEGELVRSVESIRSVETARIHLAIPKQSIFIRNRTKPSASVVVKLHSGRSLNRGQVDAIVRMVASSIPMMEATAVTVVDQFGRLLTEDEDAGMAKTSKQFEYTRQLENNYADRIINLLQPIVGADKVNAQVAAQLNFSAVESTREAYDPERSVIRSEQVSEEKVSGFSEAIGIPGALSNQPPGSGTTDAVAADAQNQAKPADSASGNQNRSSTRNFEVDRVISHTSNPVGVVQRLSVAVIIDDKRVTKDDGSVEKIPYTDQQIASFVGLVKETIGFDETRGDSVSVINTSFLEIPAEPVTPAPSWQQMIAEPWIMTLAKQILGAIGVLIIYLMFGRRILRALNPNRVEDEGQVQTLNADASQHMMPAPMGQGHMEGRVPGQAMSFDGNGMPNLAADPNNPAAMMRRKDATYDQKLEMARTLVMDDPARVANVMKHWASEE